MTRTEALGPAYFDARPLDDDGPVRVWRAKRGADFLSVVVEELPLDLVDDPAVRARILAALRAAIDVGGSDVLRVIDVVDASDRVLVVRAHEVEGRSLDVLIAHGALPPPIAARVLHDVASALHAVHPRAGVFARPGLLHGGVTAEHVHVGVDGRARISLLRTGAIVDALAPACAGRVRGLSRSMSPEAARGAPIDPRSDVYGLGIVLYEATTARRALAEMDRDLQRLTAVMDGIAPTLRGGPFDDVVATACAVDPAVRYPDAGELARALERRGAAPRSEVAALVRARCPGAFVPASTLYPLPPPFDLTHVADLPLAAGRAALAPQHRAAAACAEAERALASHDLDAAARLAQGVLVDDGVLPIVAARATYVLGQVAAARRDDARARVLYLDACARFTMAAPPAAPRVRAALSAVVDRRDALGCMDDARRGFAGLGDRAREAQATANVAALGLVAEDVAYATERFDDALALATRIGARRTAGVVVGHLAWLCAAAGHDDDARAAAARARALLADAARDDDDVQVRAIVATLPDA